MNCTDVVIYSVRRMEHDKDGAKPEQSFQQNADGKQGNRERMNLDDVVWAPCPRDGYKTAKIKVRAPCILVRSIQTHAGVFLFLK